MRPVQEMDQAMISKLKYILCDIDDTLTNHGKLTSEAYDAMWRLSNEGYEVIPVTGRPAGWCDLIVREWPVRAVVGENGAFVFYLKDGEPLTFFHPDLASPEIRTKLEAIKNACMEQVPGCRLAKDQSYRRCDLAIDFNEDVHLGLAAAEKIKEISVSMGAVAKISSIHVNVWFGSYDKVKMTQLFLEQVMGEKNLKEIVIFFGDSPNDEPMFSYFPNSCGVKNVMPFVEKMKHLPQFVTSREGGLGFAEGADQILKVGKSV